MSKFHCFWDGSRRKFEFLAHSLHIQTHLLALLLLLCLLLLCVCAAHLRLWAHGPHRLPRNSHRNKLLLMLLRLLWWVAPWSSSSCASHAIIALLWIHLLLLLHHMALLLKTSLINHHPGEREISPKSKNYENFQQGRGEKEKLKMEISASLKIFLVRPPSILLTLCVKLGQGFSKSK